MAGIWTEGSVGWELASGLDHIARRPSAAPRSTVQLHVANQQVNVSRA